MRYLSKLQAAALLWAVLASLALIGLLYTVSPILLMLVAWFGGIVSCLLFQEAFIHKK